MPGGRVSCAYNIPALAHCVPPWPLPWPLPELPYLATSSGFQPANL